MSKIQINRITNANVYMDGASFLGRAEEATLPEIKSLMSEHKALGMVGAVELFSGLDKMDCKIKWASLYPEVMRKAANPVKSVNIQVRGSLETYTGQGRTSEVPVVVHLSGTFKKFPMGTYKKHDNAEYETEMNVHYCKMVVDGEEICEVDVLENIFKVDGVDIMAQYRANIGG